MNYFANINEMKLYIVYRSCNFHWYIGIYNMAVA